ncbi:amino acid ABC transporter permease [Pararhodobacter zhoushanensis]|uniref:Amino acid ABC transporter permease n=1 Tax=Pararhodobacter zhoushanensis TaxID=2479545 RepID=A0ABT3H4L3_9RHOB|nr:amino acid ABC transporter permease [Pararhodobacter zhoushanensis]MCW1934760.1 amino acid ABC transporter permease [Pararhodobacter zhoushanensis]
MSDTHAHTVRFVRETMLPPQDPPSSQIGMVRWGRENLFDGPLNIILTVISLLVVLFLVMEMGPWFANSIWNANSLTECRQILDGASGACWGVIKDRWPQLMFGFYPPELYWRPVTALVLLFVAISPVLFPSVPKKVLYFTMVYPFLGVWLLWGGTIWGPVAVALGFVLGYGLVRATAQFSTLLSAAFVVIVPLLYWLFVAGPLVDALSAIAPLASQSVPSREFGGFLVSLVIGVSGIALSLPIGILLALGRQSNMPLIKYVSVVFIEFIRGVPLITLLFTASLLLNYFLPPGTNFDLILRVIIMVTLFASAYMAEVIRGGLAALPRGQYEAADALGLDYWKAQRLIIMPQALKISIPSIVSTFIGLFKDTTLVVFIGILDPIGLANATRASSDWQGIYWELFIFIGAVFFIFCFSMSRYSMSLERRLKTDHR